MLGFKLGKIVTLNCWIFSFSLAVNEQSSKFYEEFKSVFGNLNSDIKHSLQKNFLELDKKPGELGSEYDNKFSFDQNSSGFRFPDLWDRKLKSDLIINYGVGKKKINFKFDDIRYEFGSVKWINSNVVAPNPSKFKLHGDLALNYYNKKVYIPNNYPEKIDKSDKKKEAELCKLGGFNLKFSDALSLDRIPLDSNPSFCSNINYNYIDLPTVSVIITFFNEPFSTLMRTVHSVLNLTPPELLTEIILVDDGSDYNIEQINLDHTPVNWKRMNELLRYIDYLPKVKYMRLPHRSGIVKARLNGIKNAKGEVIVVLDSHIEVNVKWLEPQLKQLFETPNAIVTPIIFGIDHLNFDYSLTRGIGCQLGFKWSMVEQSTFSNDFKSPDPVKSASMAGGLFAVYKNYFWHLGGYDEDFEMWGAENVEMAFRTWMCGGQILCTPCARTYHIFREGGLGYSNPPESLEKNRLRTAKLWTDTKFEVAKFFISKSDNTEVGDLSKMLELKERLKCKSFDWYLDNVYFDPNNHPELLNMPFVRIDLNDIIYSDYIKNSFFCLDTMQKVNDNLQPSIYPCHYQNGSQKWIFIKLQDFFYILPSTHEKFCIDDELKFRVCTKSNDSLNWTKTKDNKLLNLKSSKCIGISKKNNKDIEMTDCNDGVNWEFTKEIVI